MHTRIAQEIYNYVVYKIASLRALFWSLFLAKIGKNCYIFKSCIIMSPAGIELGNHVGINHHTTISGHASLRIGNFVMIGPNCNILTSNHAHSRSDMPMYNQGISSGPIEIGDDVWLGANVVILPNTKIGRGSIVGANAVVTRDVEEFSIIGGVPAKLIRYRFSEEERENAKKVVFKY